MSDSLAPFGRLWLDFDQAVFWAAFRDRTAFGNWDAFTRPSLNRTWPEWGMPSGWTEGNPFPRSLAAALRGRASGKAWRPRGHPVSEGTKPRAQARKMVCQTGLDPVVLAEQLEADDRTMRGFDATMEEAKRDINDVVLNERLVAYGRRADAPMRANASAAHEPIDSALLLGPRVLEWGGNLIEDTDAPHSQIAGYKGPYYTDIRFRVPDVLKLWLPKQAEPIRPPIDRDGDVLSGGDDGLGPEPVAAASAAMTDAWNIDRHIEWWAYAKGRDRDEILGYLLRDFLDGKIEDDGAP